jgi:hypothetical protein
VVVDDVEQHAEPDRVGAIDEAAEVVGLPVEPARGEEIHAVVAPAEAAGEIGDRHEDHGRDPHVLQVVEAFRRRRPRAFRGEGAHVDFIEHLAARRNPFPGLVGPGERARVDDLRRSVGAPGLEAGRRIGERALAVEEVPVVRPGFESGEEAGEVAVLQGGQLQRGPAAAVLVLDDDLHRLPPRRPDAEADAVTAQDVGSDRRIVNNGAHGDDSRPGDARIARVVARPGAGTRRGRNGSAS